MTTEPVSCIAWLGVAVDLELIAFIGLVLVSTALIVVFGHRAAPLISLLAAVVSVWALVRVFLVNHASVESPKNERIRLPSEQTQGRSQHQPTREQWNGETGI